MSQYKEVEEFLADNSIKLESPLFEDSFESQTLIALIEIVHDGDGKQQPSNSKLKSISDRFLPDGITLVFVLRRSDMENIEGGIRATLLNNFGSDIRNAYASISDGVMHVWIDAKSAGIRARSEEVKGRLQSYFSAINIDKFDFDFIGGHNTPTKTKVLEKIRLNAPVNADKLLEMLLSDGYTIPSKDWMRRFVDSLRKSKLIVRMKNGDLALTLLALQGLGSRKNRSSPDVRRFLDLARRNA